MIGIIDCGTTFSRMFLVDGGGRVVADGRMKVGVRDTAITGSKETLRNGITELFHDVLRRGGVEPSQVKCALASGMITSEIGLVEIPHLVAPVSMNDLAQNVQIIDDPSVLAMGIPLALIPGVKNDFGADARLHSIRAVDFMRGEEVQCMGILKRAIGELPINVVVLSSHTKIIHIDKRMRICGCVTTLSGQLFEAITKETSVGKSLLTRDEEVPGGYSEDEIIDIAFESVDRAGLLRSLLMPRFMEVLLRTNSGERRLFIDAAIAADDMRAFEEAQGLGFLGDRYILVGKRERCDIYEKMITKVSPRASITSVTDTREIDGLTISGVLAVAREAGLYGR